MRRFVSLLAVGLLLTGATACGKGNSTNALPTPSPTPTGPDKVSCDSAMAVSLLVSLRLSGISIAFDVSDPEKAIETTSEGLDLMGATADEALAKITDPRVQAVVQEYKTAVDKLKSTVATSSNDPEKIITELASVADQLVPTGEKLDVLCPRVTVDPSATPGTAREAACEKIMTMQLEAFMLLGTELEQAGTDKAKIATAVAKINTALDELAGKVTALAAQTTDAELKAALQAQIPELLGLKGKLAAAAGDPKKLKDFIDNGPAGGMPATEKLGELCTK